MEIPNAFGTAVIPAVPERVVVIGFTEADTVLALGTVPVGIQQFVTLLRLRRRSVGRATAGRREPNRVHLPST